MTGGEVLAADGSASRRPARLSVHVLATTPEGTRCALVGAGRLTGGSSTRIVLLVPRVQSFDRPSDPTDAERTRIVDEHRAIAKK